MPPLQPLATIRGLITLRAMKWSMGLGTISKVFDSLPRGASNADCVCTKHLDCIICMLKRVPATS